MTASRTRHSRARTGFTLVELLVVIGIILILIGLLFPAIAAVRRQAAAAATKQEMSRLQSAINAYYLDARAYPGPIPESMLATAKTGTSPPYVSPSYTLKALSGPAITTAVTSSENLYLGLCGGLTFPGVTGTTVFGYTPANGAPLGPASLNSAAPGTHASYMNYTANETTYTNSTDPNVGLSSNINNALINAIVGATDTCVPEFIDHFSPARPILYLRARVGIVTSPTIITSMLNTIGQTNAAACQYDENQLVPYGWSATYTAGSTTSMGVSTTDFPSSGTSYSSSDQVYFANPGLVGTPIGKDGYILISAGPDGIYGTHDDIILAD